MALSKLTHRASPHHMLHIFRHLGPVVMLLEHGCGLLYSKVASQSPTMEFLNQQLTQPTLGDAQPCALKEKTGFLVEEAVGVWDA